MISPKQQRELQVSGFLPETYRPLRQPNFRAYESPPHRLVLALWLLPHAPHRIDVLKAVSLYVKRIEAKEELWGPDLEAMVELCRAQEAFERDGNIAMCKGVNTRGGQFRHVRQSSYNKHRQGTQIFR